MDARSSLIPRAVRDRFDEWRRAPDGKPRPDAPFGRGPVAARVLAHVIDAAAAVGSRLPVSVTWALATIGGHAEWAARPGKRRRLRINLAHATGQPERSHRVRQAVRHEFVNEARRSADLLWAIGRPGDFFASVDVVGAEHANDIFATGRGAVLAGLHVGGWELAAALPGRVLAAPTTVIVADNWLAWAMQHVRAASGMHMVHRSSPIAAARALRRGEALIVLGDDSWGPRPRRHRVRFCDAFAELPAGVVTLAQMSRAAIVPFSVLPVGPRKWRVTIETAIEPPARDDDDPAAVVAVLQQVADRWTAVITNHPEHWAASFHVAWQDRP